MSTFSKHDDDASLDETAPILSIRPSGAPPKPRPEQDVRHSETSGLAARRRLCAGAVVGGTYMVDSTLGAGGCGEVYAARHMTTGQRTAIKILRPDMAHEPTAVPRFIREVEALSRIAHEAIVQVYDVGELVRGIPYYAMELLEGMDLRKLLAIHQRLSPREALALLEPVAAALQAVHEHGIIHRDIKASNVFVSEQGGKRVVKLLDFGTAKLLYGEHGEGGLTAPGTSVGTPHAMAPEQIRCEPVDHRADIYSLGVLTYLLVTGSYPFNDPDRRLLALMHLQAPPPRPSKVASVPAALDEVVLKAMAKSPDDRHATALEFIEALRRAVGADAPEQRTSAAAVGIRLDIATRDDELDDEIVEDISGVLDIVEDELAGHAFDFPLRASNTLTAVRLVEASDRGRFSLEQARALLEALKAQLARRQAAHPAVTVSLSVREGAVECRSSGHGIEYVGGPLLDLEGWNGSQ
jgi:serine/threonine-protein kinase